MGAWCDPMGLCLFSTGSERKAVFLWKLVFKNEDPLMQKGLRKVLNSVVRYPWVQEIEENVVSRREIYNLIYPQRT